MDSLTTAVAQSGNLAVIVAAMAYISLLGLVVYLLRDRTERDKAREAMDKENAAATARLAESLTLLRVTIERVSK